jgi:hypothetical protein
LPRHSLRCMIPSSSFGGETLSTCQEPVEAMTSFSGFSYPPSPPCVRETWAPIVDWWVQAGTKSYPACPGTAVTAMSRYSLAAEATCPDAWVPQCPRPPFPPKLCIMQTGQGSSSYVPIIACGPSGNCVMPRPPARFPG